jgi:hypothetical protein
MLGYEITSKPKEDVSVDEMKDFLDLLIDITNKNRVASTQVEDATKLVLTEIEFKGIDFGEYLSKIKS